MKIVITQQKGGVGKSTTALIIASILTKAGREFEIVDLDPQKSFTSWASRVGLESTAGAGYKIVDTPPDITDKKTIEEMKEADVVIIPSGTSIAELEVTKNTIPIIKERTGGLVKVLWSKVQKSTNAGKELDELAEAIEADAFKTSINQRQCYQQEFLVHGIDKVNSQAVQECSDFVIELTTIK